MGKLKLLSGLEVCRILEIHGFQQGRQRGSHVVMQKKTSEGTVTVPVPDHKEIKMGTLKSIIRQPGVHRSHFE